MKYIYLIGFISFLFCSCSKDKVSYIEIERNENLKRGEWIGEKDSTSGIATRKNMIAFFEHMIVTSDSIYDYTIVDSVKVLNAQKDTLKTFLKWVNINNDTVYHELIKYDSVSIEIKHIDQQVNIYTYLTDKNRKNRDSIMENRLEFHPSFKDSVCNQTQKICFKHNFNKFLNDNFDSSLIDNLPNSRENITITFILTKDGKISNIKMEIKNELLRDEINRLLNSFPEINSGIYKGKKVEIKYSLNFEYLIKESMSSYGFGHIYLEKIDYK